MWVYVGEVSPEHLSVHTVPQPKNEELDLKRLVAEARNRQEKRFSGVSRVQLNATMNAGLIETHAQLSKEAEKVLAQASKTLHLSSRGYHRTIKLARTIADLAAHDTIEPPHMLEALQYRQQVN